MLFLELKLTYKRRKNYKRNMQRYLYPIKLFWIKYTKFAQLKFS